MRGGAAWARAREGREGRGNMHLHGRLATALCALEASELLIRHGSRLPEAQRAALLAHMSEQQQQRLLNELPLPPNAGAVYTQSTWRPCIARCCSHAASCASSRPAACARSFATEVDLSREVASCTDDAPLDCEAALRSYCLEESSVVAFLVAPRFGGLSRKQSCTLLHALAPSVGEGGEPAGGEPVGAAAASSSAAFERLDQAPLELLRVHRAVAEAEADALRAVCAELRHCRTSCHSRCA
jgi:hypothetical protein